MDRGLAHRLGDHESIVGSRPRDRFQVVAHRRTDGRLVVVGHALASSESLSELARPVVQVPIPGLHEDLPVRHVEASGVDVAEIGDRSREILPLGEIELVGLFERVG